MDVNNNLEKIKLVLENVIEGTTVLNEYFMDKLLRFLEDRSENSPGQLIRNTTNFPEFILNLYEKNDDASDAVKVFLTKIATILYKNKSHIQKVPMGGLNESCKRRILENLNRTSPPRLHVAYIELLTALIDLDLDFFIEHKVWKIVLCPNIHHATKAISKAAYDFIAKLVWKFNNNGLEIELLEVLGYILEPILTSEYLTIEVLDTETDTKLSDQIIPYMSALLAVMTEGDNNPALNKIRVLLKEHFLIDHRMYDIFNTTKNRQLLKLLNESIFRYLLLVHRHLLYSKQTEEFCSLVTIFHRNYISQACQKRDSFVIIDYVTQSIIIWSQYEKVHAANLNLPLMFERNGLTLEFSVQMVSYLIMPMVQYSTHYLITNRVEISEEIDLYVRKMSNNIADYIFSSAYIFGKILEDSSLSLSKRVTLYTLKELLKLKGHLKQTHAGALFQSLYYMLDVFIDCDGLNVIVMNKKPIDAEDLTLLSHLLNAMTMLLKEHNIPWYENLEIVSLQSNLQNLLKKDMLTTKHVIQVLDLINICIMKFLSPNMSLLVESKCSQQNTLNEIGEVIKLYMQHENWEVRDSALNILNTCTEIAFIKYTPLQKVITRDSLIIIAAKVAVTDPDTYSQCTALKCLTAATKIDNLWQEVLAVNPNIHYDLVYLMRNHGEGLVRKEATNVLTGVYTNQKLSQIFQTALYKVMVKAALDDLHWEVQLAALNFWKQAIQNHLTYRGMCHGKFPPVTFSKEKRKIIVFNDGEIRRQLSGIMQHLSSIGCLTVLLGCMNETNTVGVVEQAFCIAKELIEMLDTYNFTKLEDKNVCVKSESADDSIKYKQEEVDMDLCSALNHEERDKIIDSMLSVDQIELITHLCEHNQEIKLNEMDIDLTFSQQRKLVHPNIFIEQFRNTDYSSMIESRKNATDDYVCTLDQLLDEILDTCRYNVD